MPVLLRQSIWWRCCRRIPQPLWRRGNIKGLKYFPIRHYSHSPAVAWHIEKHHVDITKLTPTGPKGNLTKGDVLCYLDQGEKQRLANSHLVNSPINMWISLESINSLSDKIKRRIISCAIEHTLTDLNEGSKASQFKLQLDEDKSSSTPNIILEIYGVDPMIDRMVFTRHLMTYLHNPYRLLL